MKKYNITVNGKSYEVEVEEIGGAIQTAAPAPAAAPAAPKAAPAAAPKAAAPAAPKAAPAPAGATTITAPMPGTILDIKVKEGDKVTNGQVLLILEAMKMENEIMSGVDGVVSSVNVAKGASVNAGDVLVVIG
ncbi:MAG: biotin/lipoyl-binding protein [Clostridiales bacterium]|nr:biotin/lipoyl-binding protein [Clostridiales bacterium]